MKFGSGRRVWVAEDRRRQLYVTNRHPGVTRGRCCESADSHPYRRERWRQLLQGRMCM